MAAVGGVQMSVEQDCVPDAKQVPVAPVGVKVIVTLSPGVKPVTEYVNIFPIAPATTTGLAFI
jgi:hypothetical protein